MRGLTLAGVAMLAGCLEAKTVHCADGVICPEGNACALAPTYCASPPQVAACLGANLADYELCQGGTGACRGGACIACDNTNLGGCTHAGWVPMTSGSTVDLTGVWVAGPGLAYAVGRDTVLSYDGLGWDSLEVPGADFTAVWGSDPDHVFATTDKGGIYRRVDATSWVPVYEGIDSLKAIGGSGPDDIIAVSFSGNVVRSSGSSWTVQAVAGGERLYGVAARSAADVFAVGSNGMILRTAGASWVTSRAPSSSPVLRAVTATPTSGFAIGQGDTSQTRALHLAEGATAWTDAILPGAGSALFFGIWATTDDEAFAVGEGGITYHYAEGQWAKVSSGTDANLSGVHGTSRRNVFAVGAGGTILHYTGR